MFWYYDDLLFECGLDLIYCACCYCGCVAVCLDLVVVFELVNVN